MPRDTFIDALKGLTILLVILAHALQRSLPDIESNIIFNSIAAFHMPLFMFLSGYILHINKATYDINWIKRKCLRLIVPFFAWTVIFYYAINFSFTGLAPYLDYSGSLMDSVFRTVLHPGNGLWFLWSLFIFYLLAAGASMSRSPCLFGFLVLITLAGLAIIDFDLLGMYYIRFHIIFFVAGYIFSMYRADIDSFLKSNADGGRFYLPLLAIDWPYAYRSIGFALSLMFKFILGFAGIAITWMSMSFILPRIPKMQQLLSWIGSITLEIYASHLLFLNTGFGIGYINAHEPQDEAHTWRMKNLNVRSAMFCPDMGSEGS